MHYLSEVAEGSGTTASVGLATTRAACEACILLSERCQTWSDGPLISRVVLLNGQRKIQWISKACSRLRFSNPAPGQY